MVQGKRTIAVILLLFITVQVSASFSWRFRTVERTIAWVAQHIEYVRETGDRWQSPVETLRRGKGDCEDFVILCMAIIEEYNHGHSVLMCIGHNGNNRHAWLSVDDIQFECTIGCRIEAGNYELERTLTLDQIKQRRMTNQQDWIVWPIWKILNPWAY